MLRVRNRVRAVLLGALILLAGAATPQALATPEAAGRAAAAPRDVSAITPYVIRHVPDGERMVPSGWSRDPTTVVSWGGYLPPGETETWNLPSMGLVIVGYQSYPVHQIRNVSAEGQCLEAERVRNQAFLHQRPCQANHPAQKWVLIPNSSGADSYRIAPLGDPSLAVTPQHPSQRPSTQRPSTQRPSTPRPSTPSSYLWLTEPTADSEWTFDPYS